MNMPVGIGRPVVQHIAALFTGGLLHETVGVHLVPELQCFRFLLHQIRLHRESGIGQIEG